VRDLSGQEYASSAGLGWKDISGAPAKSRK